MYITEKLAFWADEKLTELYFERVSLHKAREWFYGLFIPTCTHVDHKTETKCRERGQPCRLPNYEPEGEDFIVWVCPEHMQTEGFCWGCHEFWAGCEDFDFSRNGLCSNCRDDPDLTGEWEYDDAIEDYDWGDAYP